MVVQLSLILVAAWAVFLLPSLWANRRYSALYTTREFSNFTSDLDRAVNRSRAGAGLPGFPGGGGPIRRDKVLARRRLVMGILVFAVAVGVLAFLLFRTLGVFLFSLPSHLALIGYVSALRRIKRRRMEWAFSPRPSPALLRPVNSDIPPPASESSPSVKLVV